MLFAIGLLIVIGVLAYKAAPREKEEHAHVHGAGQIGLLAALALFGVDYFTSYFYLEFRLNKLGKVKAALPLSKTAFG